MIPFAFVFPGQGSQSVGMLDAWGDHPAGRQTLLFSATLSKEIEQVFTGSGDTRAIVATTALESTPPERNAPSGTSDMSRSLTESSSRRLSSLTASSSEMLLSAVNRTSQ